MNSTEPQRSAGGWRQLAWFAGIWAAGVVAVGGFSYAVRFLIGL